MSIAPEEAGPALAAVVTAGLAEADCNEVGLCETELGGVAGALGWLACAAQAVSTVSERPATTLR